LGEGRLHDDRLDALELPRYLQIVGRTGVTREHEARGAVVDDEAGGRDGVLDRHRDDGQGPELDRLALAQRLEPERPILGGRELREVGPQPVVEAVAVEIVDHRRDGGRGHRGVAAGGGLRRLDVVHEERQPHRVVEVCVGDEDVLDAGLGAERQSASDRARLEEDVAVDEEARQAPLRDAAAVATEDLEGIGRGCQASRPAV
jgi:hypothetical protein